MKINKKLNLAPKPLKESVKIHKSENKSSKKNVNKNVSVLVPEKIKEKTPKTKDVSKKTRVNKEVKVPDKLEKPSDEVPNSKDSKVNVSDETIIKAINVIKQLDKLAQEKKTELFAEDGVISVQFDCIKIPKCVKRKLRLVLPHWLVTDTSEICLFVCDLKRGKRVDHEPTVEHYEDLFREKDIKMIKTVLPVRQLRVEYDQMEMRRRLMTQHDFFLVDSRVSGLLAHKLGKIFFQKNMLPTPVRMHAQDLQTQINKALHKTVMRLHGEGTTYSMRVANTKHTVEETCENIQAVLLQISEQFPGGWENIRSVYIKSAKSMAIPVYLTLRNKNSVVKPVVKSLRDEPDLIEGDLSTILGGSVSVHRDGTVKLKVDKSVIEEDQSDVEETPAKKPKLTEAPAVKTTKKQKKTNDVDSKKVVREAEASTSDESNDDEAEQESEEEDDDEVSGEEEEINGEENESSEAEEDDSDALDSDDD